MYNEYVDNLDSREATQMRRRDIDKSRFHVAEVKKVSGTHSLSLSTSQSENSWARASCTNIIIVRPTCPHAFSSKTQNQH
jgi:hypothetical protein